MSKEALLAAGIVAGTTIGAGIFSLPYVFSKLGFGLGTAYLFFFGFVYFSIHQMYAHLIMAEKSEHRFFSLAKKFLPRGISPVAGIIILTELILVLVVYLALAPTFLSLVFSSVGIRGLIVFWIMSSAFIFAGTTLEGITELAGITVILAIAAVILAAGGNAPLSLPLIKPLELSEYFLPFGPLLFALAARAAIPGVISEYRAAKKKNTPFSIAVTLAIGTILPILVYLFFAFGVLRLNAYPPPEGINGLFLSSFLTRLLGVLGLTTLFTSYFVMGRNIRDILRTDLSAPNSLAFGIPIALPLIFYALGLRDFLVAVSIAGGIFLSFESLFIITMWRKAFPKNPFRLISAPLYAIFVIALVYTISGFIL